MSAWWQYFWPLFAIGLVAGAVSGTLGHRRPGSRSRWPAVGAMLACAAALAWHGPFGAADRFAQAVETGARHTLTEWEMSAISAHLQRAPLTRRLDLSGPADDFQRGELVRVLSAVPGVSGASWRGARAVPLAAEGLALTLLSFVAGLLLAYVVDLRRRYNAQWNW